MSEWGDLNTERTGCVRNCNIGCTRGVKEGDLTGLGLISWVLQYWVAMKCLWGA